MNDDTDKAKETESDLLCNSPAYDPSLQQLLDEIPFLIIDSDTNTISPYQAGGTIRAIDTGIYYRWYVRCREGHGTTLKIEDQGTPTTIRITNHTLYDAWIPQDISSDTELYSVFPQLIKNLVKSEYYWGLVLPILPREPDIKRDLIRARGYDPDEEPIIYYRSVTPDEAYYAILNTFIYDTTTNNITEDLSSLIKILLIPRTPLNTDTREFPEHMPVFLPNPNAGSSFQTQIIGHKKEHTLKCLSECAVLWAFLFKFFETV